MPQKVIAATAKKLCAEILAPSIQEFVKMSIFWYLNSLAFNVKQIKCKEKICIKVKKVQALHIVETQKEFHTVRNTAEVLFKGRWP